MTLFELIKHPTLKKLKPNEFKAFFLLIEKATDNKIEQFTIRGLVREWTEQKDKINMPTGKNTIKEILRTLEKENIIKYDEENNLLLILI